VMPGGQYWDGGRVNHADSDGEGVTVCDSGGRPNRGGRSY